MAFLLILYILYPPKHEDVLIHRFIDGKQAWGGFSRKAFVNWGPLLNFAASGVVMTCSEVAPSCPPDPAVFCRVIAFERTSVDLFVVGGIRSACFGGELYWHCVSWGEFDS